MPRYRIECATEIEAESVIHADELLTVIWARVLMALVALEIRWSSAEMKISQID